MQALRKHTPGFEEMLKRHQISIHRKEIRVLQLNLGKLCNQACSHCHMEAGPTRNEIMDRRTVDRVLELSSKYIGIHTVDLTGGAPELNPEFRYLVSKFSEQKKQIIDRCNLTVFFEEGQEDTPEFLAQNKVEIIASLPCYTEENVDFQRGTQTFRKSILALQKLNSLGYGKAGSGLSLKLVYNPLGDYLPPDQLSLEQDYRLQLKQAYGIEFNQLLTITNMPIARFASMLSAEGRYESYCNLLVDQFNPLAASHIMCRELLSVGWDGKLYDCDFNQAKEIPLGTTPRTLWDISDLGELGSEIAFENHCFGCTAGCGSSCGGSLA